MHPWLIAAALSVAEPAVEPEPGPGPDGDAVGVAWHDQATVDPAIQQRLVSQLGAARVVTDAMGVARGRVALELSRERADQAPRWASQLEGATSAYRVGELDRARQEVSAVLEAIRSDPAVPGAARLVWRAQVLRGQLAWAEGDVEETDAALAAAVAIDPEARPSTREVPPPVVEAYARLRAQAVASAASWPTLEVRGPDEPFAIEIDGIPGARPVPPGEHLVVVRRPGIEPMGAVVGTDAPWSVPPREEVLPDGLPRDRAAAQRVCESAELSSLVLARTRAGRLGLQRYWCGEGFGPPWYEARDGWAPGIAALEVRTGNEAMAPVLHLARSWPQLPPLPEPRPRFAFGGDGPDGPRARLRRALPWVLITGAIAGSVTAGVLLGTDAGADLAIDGNGFLGR